MPNDGPSDAQKQWLEQVFGIPASAWPSAPGNPAPGDGQGAADPAWAKKFDDDLKKEQEKFDKLYEQTRDAIDAANAAEEKRQYDRLKHGDQVPDRPMEFYPRSGTIKTPQSVEQIELVGAAENKIVLELRIGAIPEKHQLWVLFTNVMDSGGHDLTWTFKESGTQTVKATVRPGVYQLHFGSQKVPDTGGEGPAIHCVYSLTLEAPQAKPPPKAPAPPKRP